jgi:hypothetical protein
VVGEGGVVVRTTTAGQKKTRQDKIRAIIKQLNKGFRNVNEGRKLSLCYYKRHIHCTQTHRQEGEAES